MPVTHDGNPKDLVGTDGSRLFFNEYPASGSVIAQVSISGGEAAQVSIPTPTMSLLAVSPDGATLLVADEVGPTAFQGSLWEVPVLGGSPRRLGEAAGQAAAWSPDGQRIVFDPTWSPDGTRIAFGGAPTDPTLTVRILDVKTHQISTLPDSKGLFSPRWSPDGRNLVAMPFNSRGLALFDFATQKWEQIAKISMGFPNWSKNGDYVYFLHEENQPSVMRVRIRDRKLERVADLKNFRQTGYWNVWLGLTPDDSPLLLRDTGTQEIYALDWQAP